jgi:hypothetical protein
MFEDREGYVWTKGLEGVSADRWYRDTGPGRIYLDELPPDPIEPIARNEAEAQQRYDRMIGNREVHSIRLQASDPETIRAITGALNSPQLQRVDAGLASRIASVYPSVIERIRSGALIMTPDLIKKVNGTNEVLTFFAKNPNAKQPDSVRACKSSSESLSELEHAINTIESQALTGGFVLGAEGPQFSPGQVDELEPEDLHGALPPIEVINLEADGYYCIGSVLHLDEVKDTPKALADKIVAGNQLGRQLIWLSRPLREPDQGRFTKQVGYWVQATGPGFDSVLDPRVIEGLGRLGAVQGEDVECIGFGMHRFSIRKLRALYEKAMRWIDASTPALHRRGIKLAKAGPLYFGTVELALQWSQAGALQLDDDVKPADERTQSDNE